MREETEGGKEKKGKGEIEGHVLRRFCGRLHGNSVIDDRAMLRAENKEGRRFHPRFCLANPAQRSPRSANVFHFTRLLLARRSLGGGTVAAIRSRERERERERERVRHRSSSCKSRYL